MRSKIAIKSNRKNLTAAGIRRKLTPYCRQHGILQLETFVNMYPAEPKRRRTINLIAKFQSNPGLSFFVMDEEMGEILGSPVYLLTRDSVEMMSNPYRRLSILAKASTIYQAKALREI